MPAIQIIGNVLWFADGFLLSLLPHMEKALEKKAIESVKSQRMTYLTQKTQNLNK